MAGLNRDVLLRQTCGQGFCDIDRVMLTARTANRYGEIGALEAPITWDPVLQKIPNIFNHLLYLRFPIQKIANWFVFLYPVLRKAFTQYNLILVH